MSTENLHNDGGGVNENRDAIKLACMPVSDIVSVDPIIDLLDSEFARIPIGTGTGAPTNALEFRVIDGQHVACFIDKTTGKPI